MFCIIKLEVVQLNLLQTSILMLSDTADLIVELELCRYFLSKHKLCF